MNDLNASAARYYNEFWHDSPARNCETRTIGGARLIDAGAKVPGSLRAGISLARLCMGDRAEIEISPAPTELLVDNVVSVATDAPLLACLGGQYAGWPVSIEKYFAMASGPMRMLRGREEVLKHLGLVRTATDDTVAVGVLESDQLPNDQVVSSVAEQCGVTPNRLALAIAPSTSIAGCVQVVARSIETAMHKLHELRFDVTQIVSATGQAPLPPPAKPGDTVGGIGRTNDAILYGARVTLWVDADDEEIQCIVDQVPSAHSPDHGQPFAKIFEQYDYDFYKVDPMLFSPAVVTFHSLRTGETFRSGRLVPDLLRRSFHS